MRDVALALDAERAAGKAEGRAEGMEEAAKVCERRREARFEEHGYTEPDTNASYYTGPSAEQYEARDEEDDDCARAIRARAKDAAK